MKPFVLHILIGGLSFLVFSKADVQGADTPYFIRQPARNTTVREGDSATLQCAVGNLHQVSVQWTADGFGLGMELGGRYQFEGNKAKGVYNLQINNTQLRDDGKYECQVTNKGVRSRPAYLNVLVPPKEIQLKPALNGVIDVPYPASVVTVNCVVTDAKPAATISWKVDGNIATANINSGPLSSGSQEKLFTSSSSITFSKETLRNGSVVGCIVHQEALPEFKSKTAVLNILHPPNQPMIYGITSDPMTVGKEFEAECVSDGGNPPAKITWAIGDDVLEGFYESSGTRAKNTLRYSPKQQDNGKYLRCIVKSIAITTSLEARERLEVYYPPEKILIDRDPTDGVEVNEDITFMCHHTDSNPTPTLEWLIDGVKLPSRTSNDIGAISYHTYTMTSEGERQKIALTLRRVRRESSNLVIRCRVRIPEIEFYQEVTTHPKVNYPPGKVSVTIENPLDLPVIDIHQRNDSISSKDPKTRVTFVAGHTIRLSCEAKGGNPAPNLAWFVHDDGKIEKIETTQVKVEKKEVDYSNLDGFITSSSIELYLKPTYNKATVVCKASSARYKNVTSSNVTLAVAFPPDSLRIEQFPKTSVARKPSSLTCRTTSSFPEANISWYKDGEAVHLESVNQLPLRNGKNGGYISSSRLRLFPEESDNGAEYTCQATVKPLRETVMQQYTLRVEYSPRFQQDQKYVFNATEGMRILPIKINIDSNPNSVTFNWFRYVRSTETSRGRRIRLSLMNSRFQWDNNTRTLRITGLKRDDGGTYMIQATNGRGSVKRNITLNVFYPPKIVRVTGLPAYVNEGDSTTLRCDFNSHPLTQPRVVWLKEVPGMGRSDYNVTTYADRSLLSLKNLTAEDRGGYKCIVENGVGDVDARSVLLAVSYAPVFEKSTPTKVAVSSIRRDGTVTPNVSLQCVVHSQPLAVVEWVVANNVINSTDDEMFTITQRNVGETVTSTLWVKTLDQQEINNSLVSDGLLGEFTCRASNNRGKRMKIIQIVSLGPPDSPTSVFAYNKTDTTVTLSWKEGFNGGFNQSFLVQYSLYSKRVRGGKFHELRSHKRGTTVNGLTPDKEYMIQVLAENIRGQSLPSGVIRVRTAAPKETGSTPQIDSVQTAQLFAFIAAAVVAFTLIIVTSIVLYRRCRVSKKSYHPKAIETDCESLNAESSLSSRCSTAKSPESEKFTDDTEIIELQCMSDNRRHLLRNGEVAGSVVSDLPYGNGQHNCFERSQSRCSNEIAIFRQGGCNVLGEGCTFSSFKSLPESNASPSRSLSDFRNNRGTYLTAVRPNVDHFSRDSREAKYRYNVKPTDECLGNYADDTKDSYSEDQLPPRLPRFDAIRSYVSTCGNDSKNHTPYEDYQLQVQSPQTDNGGYQSGVCPLPGNYHTIGSNVPNCSFYSGVPADWGCSKCPDMINYGVNRTSSYQAASTLDNCYYTLATSTSREYASRYPFTSTIGSTLTNSKSVTNLRSENFVENGPKLNNTKTSDTTDFPPPPLEVIEERHSWEVPTNNVLQSYTMDKVESAGNFKSSFRRNHEGSAKCSQTQSVRFQDDLAETVPNICPISVARPSPHNLEHDTSDDDTDSGCGGSADVQVRRIVPVKPKSSSNLTSSHSNTTSRRTELRELRV